VSLLDESPEKVRTHRRLRYRPLTVWRSIDYRARGVLCLLSSILLCVLVPVLWQVPLYAITRHSGAVRDCIPAKILDTDPNKPPVRIAMLTLDIPDGHKRWERAAPIAHANKQEYARRHGYTYIVHREAAEGLWDKRWTKVKALQENLQNFDWVFWTDLDSVIVEKDVRLEEFIDWHYDIVISEDGQTINNGMFFLKNSEFSFWFLQRWWASCDPDSHTWFDQDGMELVLQNELKLARRDPLHSHVKLVPQCAFNSYPFFEGANGLHGVYMYGDFAVHLAGLASYKPILMQRLLDHWFTYDRRHTESALLRYD